jgi:phosphoribosylformimino-5-aminoimidazole carboxamide ribonucleotide (ProFAR) isomerase
MSPCRTWGSGAGLESRPTTTTERARMIIPCIDLMDGKVVQLVQGREKALEGAPPLEMLERFSGFPVIQVIDLDAALGKGENNAIVELLASRARIRAGGGVRTPERAQALIAVARKRSSSARRRLRRPASTTNCSAPSRQQSERRRSWSRSTPRADALS